jgi:hypothetical protein
MRPRFARRHVVTGVIAICVAVSLSPLVGRAASDVADGLVRIVDRSDPSRSARVTPSGTLQVEARPGVRGGAFNRHANALDPGFVNLVSVISPRRLAITEMTLNGVGPAADTQDVVLEARVGADAACNGGTSQTLRRVSVDIEDTLALNFSGPPLYMPTAATGQRVCFGFRVVVLPVGSTIFVGATGYRFSP